MNMVERAARAFETYAVTGGDDWGYIYRFRGPNGGESLKDFENYDDAYAECKLWNARAAIAAMREPTEEMVEMFYRAYERPLSAERWESNFSNAIEAFFDAALQEDK